jgi:hypothetical protein
MNEIGFDKEAIDFLSAELDKILAEPEAKALFEECVALYEENIDRDYKELVAKAKKAAELTGVHHYTSEMLMFILLTKHLRKLYKEKNISDRIWFDSVSDLKWKLWECKAVKGIWGSFVDVWYYRFFDMTRFALGRLQFEISEIKEDREINGRPLKKGMKAISIHIPRTLTPLTKESRLDAYRQAEETFRSEFGESPVIFTCHSWLLSEEMPSMLKEGSNLKGFIEDFHIVKYEKCKEGDYPDAWRLFDMDYTGNIDDYPGDSSLRRNYKEYLKNGGIMGCGLGFFFADEVIG